MFYFNKDKHGKIYDVFLCLIIKYHIGRTMNMYFFSIIRLKYTIFAEKRER